MEHKVAPLRLKKVVAPEPCHYCGKCKYKTEEQVVGDLVIWEEHCLAGYSREHMRHTVNCDRWERSPYA